jgi:hypothetical protein
MYRFKNLMEKLPALVAILGGLTLARIAFGKVRTHLLLKRIPGPPVSSYLWGEEWELYHSAPGSLYTSWHKRYGSVVRFSGAFGVALSSHFAFILSSHPKR